MDGAAVGCAGTVGAGTVSEGVGGDGKLGRVGTAGFTRVSSPSVKGLFGAGASLVAGAVLKGLMPVAIWEGTRGRQKGAKKR